MSSPSEGRVLRYVDALLEGTIQEMERDPRVVLFGLDVTDHKAIQGSTRGLRDRFGPERVFGTPLSEDAMTGVAVGAAMSGLRPIHVHIRNDFLMLCMNQLVNIAAKARHMYNGRVGVPMVARSMIGKSWGQGAQHSQALHAMFAHVPGLKVVLPSNARDAKGAMIAAIRDEDPVLVIEHRLLYPTEAVVPEEPFAIEFGRSRVRAEGDDVTVVGISNMVPECLWARELLADVGISAEVIDPVTVAPLDADTILASARRTKRLLIADNAWTCCGVSAEIAARVAEAGGPTAGISIRRLGFAPTTCPTTPSLEEGFYPDATTVAVAARAMVTGRDDWAPDPERARAMPRAPFRGPF